MLRIAPAADADSGAFYCPTPVPYVQTKALPPHGEKHEPQSHDARAARHVRACRRRSGPDRDIAPAPRASAGRACGGIRNRPGSVSGAIGSDFPRDPILLGLFSPAARTLSQPRKTRLLRREGGAHSAPTRPDPDRATSAFSDWNHRGNFYFGVISIFAYFRNYPRSLKHVQISRPGLALGLPLAPQDDIERARPAMPWMGVADRGDIAGMA